MAAKSSIQPGMLHALAAFAATEVASVLVNDTHVVPRSAFKVATSSGDTTTIEYEVPEGTVSGPITNLKLRNAQGDVLAVGSVYIDSTYTVALKHTLTFKEGE